MNPHLNDLQRRFAGADFLSFVELAPDFIAIQVRTEFSAATIALQGAHVMTWQPNNQPPVVWLSKGAKFAPGKSIRGGVPLCWPWFGPHASESAYPGHGFARTIPWALLSALKLPDGRVRLEFEPILNDTAHLQWPYPATVRNSIIVGQALEIDLTTSNTGGTRFELGQALHTYFEIGDIGQISVVGLAGCEYIDKVDGASRKKQAGTVTFNGETDRIYLDTAGWCEIHDPQLKRRIVITSTGSRSTVVWNPGAEKAEKMGDFGTDGWRATVCVESANAAKDVLTLAPGESHRLAVQYRAIPL